MFSCSVKSIINQEDRQFESKCTEFQNTQVSEKINEFERGNRQKYNNNRKL